jgi:hypothetical protein
VVEAASVSSIERRRLVGKHAITVRRGVEADGGTWWRFTVTIPTVPADHWKAEYFGNATVSGAPVATVDEGTGFVDHGWGDGGPAGLADHFSARFTRTVTLAAGTYRFTITTDDGSEPYRESRRSSYVSQAEMPSAARTRSCVLRNRAAAAPHRRRAVSSCAEGRGQDLRADHRIRPAGG